MQGSHRKSLFSYFTVIARATSPVLPRSQVASSSSPFCALIHYSAFTSISANTETSKKQSFTVNYLINNCGFLPDSALQASKYVLFEHPEKPDSVLALFRSFGFSDSQLHLIVRKQPRILKSHPTRTLLPKLQFLISKGASTQQLTRVITQNPVILLRSLENYLIPTFNLINSFIQSDEKTIFCIVRGNRIFSRSGLQRSITLLVDAGVRETSISRILRQWPWLLSSNFDILRNNVEEVMEMGISPSRSNFVPALYARMLPESMWDKKVELFKRLGWTDDAIRKAFVRNPFCVLASEQKIEACIGFVVNELGWKPVAVSHYPVLLSLSLEKRIVPRAAVVQVLMSSGLVKRTKHICAYTLSEQFFFQRYVNHFKDQAPQLLKLYQDKMKLAGMGSQ